MKIIKPQISIPTQSLLTGSALMFVAAIAQAQSGNGSISFSPLRSGAEAVPTLGSTLLILLAVLLAFIAFVSFRKRQSGIAPVIAGALTLASLASAGGGISLMNEANAGSGFTINNPAGETFVIFGNSYNEYFNNSGVILKVGSLTLPNNCGVGGPRGRAPTLECDLGTELAVEERCVVDCRDDFEE